MNDIQFIKSTKADIKRVVKLVVSGVPYSIARLKVLQSSNYIKELDELLTKKDRVVNRIIMETVDNRYEHAVEYFSAHRVIDLHMLYTPEDSTKLLTKLNDKMEDLTRQLDEITIYDFNQYDLDNLFLALDILGVGCYEHINLVSGLHNLLNRLYTMICNTDVSKVEYNDNITISIALLTQTCRELLNNELEEYTGLTTSSIFS